MTRYIIFTGGPTVGMDCAYAHVCSPDKIESDGFEIAIEHLELYGYDYDPEAEDDYETVTSDIDFNYEIYNGREHDAYRQGGGSFLDEFERMEK